MTATDPAHGTVVVNADNTITYTPDLNWTGTDTYTYEITDNNGGFDTATVTIDVTPINDPPVANDDLYSTSEDTPLTVPLPGLLGNDTDPENDTLTVTLNTQPANGTVTVNPDGSFTYTPNLNWTGTDTYTYEITDGNGETDTATVIVDVTPVADTPTAVDDVYSTPEDTPLTVPAPGVLGNDTDVENDPLTVGVYTQPAHGSVTVNPDGSFTYTPDLNWTGTDTYTYEACDPLCDTATVTIDVTPVNDPPVANDDLAVTDEDTPVTVPVLADDNDVDGPLDPTSVTVTAAPSDGTTTRQPRRHGHLHPQPRVLGHRQLRLPGVRPRPHPPLRHRHRASNRQLGQRPTPSRRRHRHHPRGHPSHHPVLGQRHRPRQRPDRCGDRHRPRPRDRGRQRR